MYKHDLAKCLPVDKEFFFSELVICSITQLLFSLVFSFTLACPTNRCSSPISASIERLLDRINFVLSTRICNISMSDVSFYSIG